MNWNFRNGETFWTTTGLLPQSLTISFPQAVQIKDISLTSFKSSLTF